VGRRYSTACRSAATSASRLLSCCCSPYNWSGFYIGGNLGAAWNSGGSVSDTFGSTFSRSGQTTKFVGGGQVGVNYEFREAIVIGAEAMFDWLPNTTTRSTQLKAPADRFLVPQPRRPSIIDG
jgi:opacity protein-like surface antigen